MQGLSPRVRGSRKSGSMRARVVRSIPACAGEPKEVRRGAGLHMVYPRVCGGAEVHGHEEDIDGGLSPRVRGSPDQDAEVQDSQGSIPACAGEPDTKSAIRATPQVYPRVCGGALRLLGRP